jgi:hypothetical protein
MATTPEQMNLFETEVKPRSMNEYMLFEYQKEVALRTTPELKELRIEALEQLSHAETRVHMLNRLIDGRVQ